MSFDRRSFSILGGLWALIGAALSLPAAAYLFGGPKSKKESNWIDAGDITKLPMNQKQYGASLGGPIVRNRTFYFTNAEQRRLTQTGLTTISTGNVDLVNARLRAVGIGRGRAGG